MCEQDNTIRWSQRCLACGCLTLGLLWLVAAVGCAAERAGPADFDPPATAPVSETGVESAGGSFYVVYETSPDPIPLNESFDMTVSIFDAKNRDIMLIDVALDVDGRMPHHRHGMNVQPEIMRRDDGSYRVVGMLFHMPGRWELYFDVTRAGLTERAQSVVVLD